MTPHLARVLSLLALPLVVACPQPSDTIDDTDAIDDTDEEAADTTAPRVVSTSPEDDAGGVAAGVIVRIGFSEPMDRASVETALDAASLGPVALQWSDAGDEISIIPAEPLPYATGYGADPSVVVPRSFAVRIDGGATDLAGNPLADGLELTFETMREMSIAISPVHGLTRSLTPSTLRYADTDPLVVGDDADDDGIRATLTFDLSGLPDDAVAVTEAIIVTRQLTGEQWGAPYTDLGETVLVDHVLFDDLDGELSINAAFNASQVALSSRDGFSEDDVVSVAFDATAQVTDDLAHREERADLSQFLLRFETPTDLDGAHDRAVFSRDSLELEVTYLAP